MKYHFGWPIIALLLLAACGGKATSTLSAQPKSQTVGGAETNVVESVSAMSVGDIYYIQFDDSGDSSISFDGTDPDASYMLLVQSTNTSSSSVSVTADVFAGEPKNFETLLRTNEAGLADNGDEPVQAKAGLGKSIAKATGDTGTFRVLSSISSITSYTTVTATAKCTMDHVVFYVDNTVPSTSLDSSDIATLCDQFEYAAAAEESVLGSPSDVNGDGRVVVLSTLAINRLGASGGGIITGYFFASDLYNRSTSNPTSNEQEIIYILAPDPNGAEGTSISKDFAMSNLMTAVVPHELQHAISYNRHVLVNGGSTEASWLNEAMSHFSEDLVGFGQENPSRVEVFLSAPETTSLAPFSSPSLDERGAEYLFLRFLYEQAENPSEFLANLENTTDTGTDNVESAFAGSDANFDEWNEFMRRWAIAIAMTNTGISSTPQYQFKDRTYNSTTGHWGGVCMICEADDNRGTVLLGPSSYEIFGGTASVSLSGTATAFYTVTAPSSSIALSGSASAGLQGMLIRTE